MLASMVSYSSSYSSTSLLALNFPLTTRLASENKTEKPNDNKELSQPESIRGSLTIVGSGIQAIRQLTLEARQSIERADKVLILVDDPITEMYIKKLNPNAESLGYFRDKPRHDSYRQWTEVTLKHIREGLNVCVVCYGHPTVFVNSSRQSIRQARSEGYSARMLPGISAEDCLFADFGIDPAVPGCQSFEATDFLLRKHKIDTSCHLILWQIGVIGDLTYNPSRDAKPSLRILVDFLKKYYDSSHTVFVYEAAKYAICKPIIQRMLLSKLGDAHVNYFSTLYIPPKMLAPLDYGMADRLGMNVESNEIDIHFSVKKLFRL